MAVEKRLAYSIVQFLRDQTHCGSLNSDEQESLEVAVQCLETTFKISSRDYHLAAPQPLREIFLNSLLKNDIVTLPETFPSPEDIERAELLKNEGNNHMKEENYSSALDCYTKAIELDQRNAVYYCNRAAAHSKLGHYTEATGDCERAIAIDPSYSKAYGRMGLALTSMSKYPEAISYFNKALVLDPENDTYKSNLKIAEQKQREASSPTATGLGFDMASLINNPAFISMVCASGWFHFFLLIVFMKRVINRPCGPSFICLDARAKGPVSWRPERERVVSSTLQQFRNWDTFIKRTRTILRPKCTKSKVGMNALAVLQGLEVRSSILPCSTSI
uniref:Small glutamine-rich tetratricopeptide repeat-containing protein beta n=1 Tax=Cyprinus carpio carpio TaxID=630221 RepID=A0A9J8BRV6_CYPCA